MLLKVIYSLDVFIINNGLCCIRSLQFFLYCVVVVVLRGVCVCVLAKLQKIFNDETPPPPSTNYIYNITTNTYRTRSENKKDRRIR